ncbi:hypothetical protein B0H63DRAFT_485429 [Podospora didyma]|uniref:Uncharacterized protein n=1 Tax=Podospora didyma TaxID=330526 RepID=A0AAE0K9P3_9PEZI|nr:hypothetical protein B0H63DRAFT_485429 [Podospora didyma]
MYLFNQRVGTAFVFWLPPWLFMEGGSGVSAFMIVQLSLEMFDCVLELLDEWTPITSQAFHDASAAILGNLVQHWSFVRGVFEELLEVTQVDLCHPSLLRV